jgi:hypothetical protein
MFKMFGKSLIYLRKVESMVSSSYLFGDRPSTRIILHSYSLRTPAQTFHTGIYFS